MAHVLCSAPVRVAPHSLCGVALRPGQGTMPLPGLELVCASCRAVKLALEAAAA